MRRAPSGVQMAASLQHHMMTRHCSSITCPATCWQSLQQMLAKRQSHQHQSTWHPIPSQERGVQSLTSAFSQDSDLKMHPHVFFITCSQEHPIHLRDAFNGTLRNTYRPFNNVEEVCHAYSLCFSADGGQILAGFDRTIRIFDLQRPGRQTEEWLLSTRAGKGQKGIIGSLAASIASPGVYAAGSYSKSICIYQRGCKGKPLMWLSDCQASYEMGGVTQLVWVNEWMLLSGHRCDRWLRFWDLRKADSERHKESTLQAPKALLHRFPRHTRTHQRFGFSTKGDLLSTGDDSGAILFYSLSHLSETGIIREAHGRPCVSAMLHPTLDIILSSSGSRDFPDYDVDSPTPERGLGLKPSVGEPKKRKACCTSKREPERDGRLSALDNSTRIWQLSWSERVGQ